MYVRISIKTQVTREGQRQYNSPSFCRICDPFQMGHAKRSTNQSGSNQFVCSPNPNSGLKKATKIHTQRTVGHSPAQTLCSLCNCTTDTHLCCLHPSSSIIITTQRKKIPYHYHSITLPFPPLDHSKHDDDFSSSQGDSSCVGDCGSNGNYDALCSPCVCTTRNSNKNKNISSSWIWCVSYCDTTRTSSS